MKKRFVGWIKVLLIILGIGLVAGTIILLVKNEPKLEEMPNHSEEVLATKKTITSIQCRLNA